MSTAIPIGTAQAMPAIHRFPITKESVLTFAC
jgi:hypothetical protein